MEEFKMTFIHRIGDWPREKHKKCPQHNPLYKLKLKAKSMVKFNLRCLNASLLKEFKS